jgi:chromosomal replication initiation ATPase DnaA
MRNDIATLLRSFDFESVVATLNKSAGRANVSIPPDVELYLSRNVGSNARDLRAALMSLVTYSCMTGTEITLARAQQVLKKMIDAKARKSTFDPIQSVYQQYLAKQTEAKSEHRVAEGRGFALCLKTRDGKKASGVRLELEVNMRESERKQLAGRDAYERDLERRARKRSQS